MADVTVFVDDAVLGQLPAVCVKDGCYTTDRLVVRQPQWNSNGLGIAWLLVLAGPLGWLGLIVIASTRRSGGDLTVTLPFSEEAHERLVRSRHDRWVFAVATIAFAVVSVVSFYQQSLVNYSLARTLLGIVAGVVTVSCLVGWMTANARLRKSGVDVDLDASHRWVTLSRVHPNFAEAVQHRRDYSDSI
jgi:hypothetical protein